MNCDDVFVILTRGPFPSGARTDSCVEAHLQVCPECQRLAAALRPNERGSPDAVELEESRHLPGYWGNSLESSGELAISLTAANDQLRTELMPINRKWDLEKLMAAAREFPLRNRERITFEYVLLKGVNDSPGHARELAELVRDVECKVNLIALNPGPGIQFETPEENSVVEFQKILAKGRVPVFVRRPRGRDIYAACGQLKRTVELAT
jgi:23S rRNA (adenine2503-C2)-methyltransferase